MLTDLLFLAFASILLIGALGVISAKNPVYCILFLLLTFFNAAGLCILMGAEFIALLLIMIYVGAIAVMFLFVLMTIDVDFAVLRQGFASYMPMGIMVGLILAIELVATLAYLPSPVQATQQTVTSGEDNLIQLGHVLFTDYALPFLTAGMILLVAMLGAIVLTHRKRPGVKRQNILAQTARTKSQSITLAQPRKGQGVGADYWEGKGVDA